MATRRPRATPREPTLFDVVSAAPGADATPAAPDLPRRLAEQHAAAARLAERLPAGLRFGTSSWSFPGWAGLVWSRAASTSWLSRNGLVEYARHPLLRTVGIDRGFYAPIPERDLELYASELPAGYPCCTKAPASVTSAVLLDHRPGAKRNQPNPHYLDPARFQSEMLEPFSRSFAAHSGPFLLQFPPASKKLRPSPAEFAARLDAFLSALPRELRYAVELRVAELVTPAYREVLARHGVAHVYNYAAWMPGIAAQEQEIPLDSAPFVMVRLLLRPGTGYEQRRDLFEPFDRIVDPDPAMRSEVTQLIGKATRTRRDTFVLVNNKAEGSAPLTIEALATAVVAAGPAGSGGG